MLKIQTNKQTKKFNNGCMLNIEDPLFLHINKNLDPETPEPQN